MKTMHGIKDEDWEAYVEGALTSVDRDRLEAHLTGCLGCWERVEMLQITTEQLREAGAQARLSLPLRDAQLHTGLLGAFAKLRAAEEAAEAATIRQRLHALSKVLAGMCGSATAAKALQIAAQRSTAQTLERVTPHNWDSFLTRLTSIATVMCGETGAHLVRESGRL
jgi:anti-sigma factor RsiW